MPSNNESQNLAIFCDFENVALGVRDARIKQFNIDLVLERLLVKGTVVVKKAYCDWQRYKEFKPVMHDAAPVSTKVITAFVLSAICWRRPNAAG